MVEAIVAGELAPFEAIGKGVCDIYEGPLSAEAMLAEVAAWLDARDLADAASFRDHLEAHGDIARRGHYVELTLSDGSRWVLRGGEDPAPGAPFVHVHPVRHGPQTFRARTTTLKTALVAWGLSHPDAPTLETVNAARDRVALPPLNALPEGLEALIARIAARIADRLDPPTPAAGG